MAAAAETRTYGRPRPQCRAARPTSQPPIRVLTPKQKQSEGERGRERRGTNKRRCRAQPFAAQPGPARPGRRWGRSMSSRLTTCTVSGEHPFPGAGVERVTRASGLGLDLDLDLAGCQRGSAADSSSTASRSGPGHGGGEGGRSVCGEAIETPTIDAQNEWSPDPPFVQL